MPPIEIANISPHRAPHELSDYEISINGKPIVAFTHFRDLGLADCLSLAADAVRRLGAAEKLALKDKQE